jgi:DNA-binding transcriptional regulator YiaG
MAKKRPGTWPAKLKQLRERLGITQAEAAERAGVALRTWINWENAHQQPSRPAQKLIVIAFPELK